MDGATSMTGKTGFLCTNDDDFPDFLHYHYIIHQQALCFKVLKMQHIMGICLFSIGERSFQRRIFRSQLEANESEHGELVYHADVRWLNRGVFLQRCKMLKSFLYQERRCLFNSMITNG
jgi:hypothetical protein